MKLDLELEENCGGGHGRVGRGPGHRSRSRGDHQRQGVNVVHKA